MNHRKIEVKCENCGEVLGTVYEYEEEGGSYDTTYPNFDSYELDGKTLCESCFEELKKENGETE